MTNISTDRTKLYYFINLIHYNMKHTYFLLIAIMLFMGSVSANAADYSSYNKALTKAAAITMPASKATAAEIPNITMQQSDQDQTVEVDLSYYKETIEENTFNEVFISNSSYILLDEEGAAVEGVTLLYNEASVLEMTVSANTTVKEAKYYLGQDFGGGEILDFRWYGIEISLYLSVTGDGETTMIEGTLPATSVQYSEEDQTVEISLAALKAEWDAIDTSYFGKVFAEGKTYMMQTADKDFVPDVEMTYSPAKQSLIATVFGGVLVPLDTYYLMDGDSRQDYRDLGFEVSITFSVKEPAPAYQAEDIVIEAYTAYNPTFIEGYADKMKELLGEELFNQTFEQRGSYVFVDTETGEKINNVTLMYSRNDDQVYEFNVLVSADNVSVENRNVMLYKYDWNIEDKVELPVDITLNLTIKQAEIKLVEGTLPDTKVIFTQDDNSFEISTAALKEAWDFENPEYYNTVFVQDDVYLLGTEDAETLLDLDMVYDPEKEALTGNVYSETPEGTYYLMSLMRGDLRTLGYSVSIVFSATEGVGIQSSEAETAKVSTTTGAIIIEGDADNVTVYRPDGCIEATTSVNGTETISLDKGLYIVRVDDKVHKVIVK